MSEATFSFPLWLILFMVAGFLLFILKTSSPEKSPGKESKRIVSLRLFLIIAIILIVLSGLVHFYHWAQPY